MSSSTFPPGLVADSSYAYPGSSLAASLHRLCGVEHSRACDVRGIAVAESASWLSRLPQPVESRTGQRWRTASWTALRSVWQLGFPARSPGRIHAHPRTAAARATPCTSWRRRSRWKHAKRSWSCRSRTRRAWVDRWWITRPEAAAWIRSMATTAAAARRARRPATTATARWPGWHVAASTARWQRATVSQRSTSQHSVVFVGCGSGRRADKQPARAGTVAPRAAVYKRSAVDKRSGSIAARAIRRRTDAEACGDAAG